MAQIYILCYCGESEIVFVEVYQIERKRKMKLYYIREVKVSERPGLKIDKKGLHIVKRPVIKKVKFAVEIEQRIERG